MAYVDPKHSAIGSSLQLQVRGKSNQAKVIKMPFVPNNYFHLKDNDLL